MMTHLIISYDFWRSEHRTGGSTDPISTAYEKQIIVKTLISTFAIRPGDGEGDRQDEGTSSCIVPVLSRSNILVCSCDATFSVLTDRQTGPKFSSVPVRFRCSCENKTPQIRGSNTEDNTSSATMDEQYRSTALLSKY
jgi:hypothetical protein